MPKSTDRKSMSLLSLNQLEYDNLLEAFDPLIKEKISLIMKKWDKPTSNSKIEVLGTVTNYCRFCGLQLFKDCISCGSANFAHLPFCSNCGDRVEV
jgi:hypothetical protein